jgi:two-component system phosphate regulon sensor histidine kinase PhoR
LTVVNGFLETLIDAQTESGTARQHHLHLMHEQAQRMHRLVEDLLTLSRLESQETPVSDELVDVRQLVREVADEARALSLGRHQINVALHRHSCGAAARNCAARLGTSSRTRCVTHQMAEPSHFSWREDSSGGRFEVSDTGLGVAPDHYSSVN